MQGHVDAWFHLGVMHLKGWGTRISRHQATQFFAQAAKLGHLLAMYNLAMMHLTDRSVFMRACVPTCFCYYGGQEAAERFGALPCDQLH